MTPKRIQLRRTRGWRKPPGAIIVARPSKWGNPWSVANEIDRLLRMKTMAIVENSKAKD